MYFKDNSVHGNYLLLISISTSNLIFTTSPLNIILFITSSNERNLNARVLYADSNLHKLRRNAPYSCTEYVSIASLYVCMYVYKNLRTPFVVIWCYSRCLTLPFSNLLKYKFSDTIRCIFARLVTVHVCER